MKRRLFLMLAVLMQMAGMQLVAQTSSLLTMELGDPLIYDGSQITSNASDEVEGLNMDFLVDGNPNTFWHSDWHGKVAESHYLQFELLDPITDDNLVIYVQRRNIEKDHLTNATITASSDGETWEQIADVEFGNAYALGEFVTDPIRISKPYSYIRITRNPVGDENIFFHLAEIELYNPSDNMYTAGILNNTFIKYETYYWDENGEELNMGTGFGQHSDFDSWKEFLKMMDKVLYYLTERDVADFPNREEAQEIGRTVDSLYQKIVDSEVPFVLPQTEGYYRIIANLPFYTEEVVGKDDNNLDIIERTYHTKAMFCSLDEKGAWGTLQEDRANFLWKLTQTGDSIDMYNAGMETRFSVFGSSVKMSQESDTHVIMDWAGNENGRDIIYIRPAAGSKNGSDYLHMSSHNRGRQTDDKVLCTWVGTFNMGEPYESDKGTSEWYLEPVSDEEAAALIEAFGMVKNHEILVAENEKLRREVEQEIAVAKDPILKPLITSASQMTSPFSQNDLGARDGGDLSEGVLLDGNLGTYWHSVWSNGAVGQGEHYIQVSDMEEMTDDIKIYVGRRQVGEGHVTEFQLRGSNDPDAEKEDWKILATQSIGNASNGAEYTTPAFNVGQTPYAYVRLYATQNTYWHCSELQIYKSLENPNSQFASLGEIAIKLEEEFLRNSAISDDDLTPEDYKALEEAYMAFRAGLVDPTELRNALAFYAGAANGNVEGTETGFWSNSQAKDDFVKLYTEVEEYNNAGRYDENQNRIYVAALQAASETLERGAIGIDTDSWYHLKFASADMYDENNWDKGNVESSDMGVNLYGTYVTVGQTIYEEDQLVDIQEYNANDMREGNGMYFLPEDQCSKQDASLFRFILAENPADSISDFNSLLAKARNAIEINTRYTYGDNLITDARQLSSNASDRAEGQYIENLIDNDPNTFWHSDWHGEATSTHYLQVALTKPISDPVQVIVTRRQGTNGGNIERMYMAGSNDGQEWTNIGYVDLPYRQVNETVTSKPVALGGTYSYLRFYLTKRSEDSKEYIPMGEDWTFFHAAEFQVRTVKLTSDESPSLSQVYAAANAIIINRVTSEDCNTLLAAYQAVAKDMNAAGKYLVPEVERKQTYIIQNKANGLFVHSAKANNNDVTLKLSPTFYTFNAIGYGECLLHGTNLDGTDCTNLHAQRSNQRLVTWESSTAGTNSGLMLEKAESVDNTEFIFYKDINEGELYGWCYPVDIQNTGDGIAYTVEGKYYIEDEGTFLALKETENITAAQPVIYLYGDTIAYSTDAPSYPMAFAINMKDAKDMTLTAGSANGLRGCLVPTPLAEGDIYFEGNKAVRVDDKEQTIEANKVILSLADCPVISEDGDYELSIYIGQDDSNGIKDISSTVSKVTGNGAVYTIDGRQILEDGSLSDIKRLGRGIYILNGVKVMVK